MTGLTPDEALALTGLASQTECNVKDRFHRGRASELWRVDCRGRVYLLRIDTPRAAELGYDRSEELAINDCVAAAGLAPRIVASAPGDGVTVTEFVPGRAWTPADLRDPRKLASLAGMLRRLHALRPPVRNFDLPAALSNYAHAIGDEAAYAAAATAMGLLQQATPRAPVLCHNDLVAANVIEGQRLWIIDWEYAGLGHPFFDLAVVAQHHRLCVRLRDTLLNAYLDEVDQQARDELRLWCRIYDRVMLLWRRLPAARSRQPY